MPQIKKFNYKTYFKFLNNLAKELTRFYNKKLSKSFQVTNKLKGRGYDPVTSSDKAFERFIRSKITKKFPEHQIIGEEFGKKMNSLRKKNMDYQTERRSAIDKITLKIFS